jgi:hypothetical protein
VIAKDRPSSKACKFCRQDILALASVCHHCNRVQSWWKFHHIELGSLVSLLISIALFMLSVAQLRTANTERSRAEAAVQEAKELRGAAKSLQAEQVRLREGMHRLQIENFSNLCRAGGGSFDHATGVCHLASGEELAFSDPLSER